MSLTKEDLLAISDIMDKKLQPMHDQLDKVELQFQPIYDRLDKVELQLQPILDRLDKMEPQFQLIYDQLDKMSSTIYIIKFNQGHISEKLKGIEITMNYNDYRLSRNIKNLQEDVDTIVEILKIHNMIPIAT